MTFREACLVLQENSTFTKTQGTLIKCVNLALAVSETKQVQQYGIEYVIVNVMCDWPIQISKDMFKY